MDSGGRFRVWSVGGSMVGMEDGMGRVVTEESVIGRWWMR